MTDLVNISPGNAAVAALLGYAVVFLGIVALMLVIAFFMWKYQKQIVALAEKRWPHSRKEKQYVSKSSNV